MNLDYCAICGKLDFLEKHTCPPLWYCGFYKDECTGRIFAPDAAKAAEEYCYFLDSRGYGDWEREREVYVYDPRTGEIKLFLVKLQSDPIYTAKEVNS